MEFCEHNETTPLLNSQSHRQNEQYRIETAPTSQYTREAFLSRLLPQWSSLQWRVTGFGALLLLFIHAFRRMRWLLSRQTDADVAMTQAQHISAACSAANGLSASGLWTFVGEWSTASTDCATYLNGRGVGSRYDGSFSGSPRVGSCTGLSGSATSFSSEYKQFLRQYYEAQVRSLHRGAHVVNSSPGYRCR